MTKDERDNQAPEVVTSQGYFWWKAEISIFPLPKKRIFSSFVLLLTAFVLCSLRLKEEKLLCFDNKLFLFIVAKHKTLENVENDHEKGLYWGKIADDVVENLLFGGTILSLTNTKLMINDFFFLSISTRNFFLHFLRFRQFRRQKEKRRKQQKLIKRKRVFLFVFSYHSHRNWFRQLTWSRHAMRIFSTYGKVIGNTAR